jgi:glycosyltransferase A (GT-A) superfamily protein (DUF2064 family)
MCWAAERGLSQGTAVVLIGTDCPEMDAHYVRSAIRALMGRDAVLGPAEDGGYVLLALKRPGRGLFKGVPWGTEEVASVTRQRMAALGWKWLELPTLWDLDRPADLERYFRSVTAAE